MHNDELFNELLLEISSKGKEYKEKKAKEKDLFCEKVNSANELLKEIHEEYSSDIKKLLKVAEDNELCIDRVISGRMKYEYFNASLIYDDNVICFGPSENAYSRGSQYVKSNGNFVKDDYFGGDAKEIKNIGFKYMIKQIERFPVDLPFYLEKLNFFLEHGKEFAAKLIATVTVDLLRQSEKKLKE